jgi:two-component system LytT family sensor kinase
MTRNWLWIAGLWSALAIANATQTVVGMMAQGMQHDWPALFGTVALTFLPWTLATPVVVRVTHRYPPVAASGLRGAGWHLLVCTAIAVVYGFWSAWLQILLKPLGPGTIYTPLPQFAFSMLLGYLHLNVITYAAILAVVSTLKSRQRLAQREMEASRLSAQLSLARLEAFRRQLAPHFLFNALNGISGLVRCGSNEQAVSMIAGFSEFLRYLLRDGDRQEIPLAEEIECLGQYVAIQRMRFADRLKFETKIPADLQAVQVPALLLQPVVENAIEHGIGKRAAGGTISVTATRSRTAVTICVYNDGPELSPHWGSATGIGIRNTQARLKSLFGEDGTFELRNCDWNGGAGVEAIVTLPCAAPA